MAIDGTWCRDCQLIDVSETGAQIRLTGPAVNDTEFFLLLTNFGDPVFRMCVRRWVDGTLMGVSFHRKFIRAKPLAQAAALAATTQCITGFPLLMLWTAPPPAHRCHGGGIVVELAFFGGLTPCATRPSWTFASCRAVSGVSQQMDCGHHDERKQIRNERIHCDLRSSCMGRRNSLAGKGESFISTIFEFA
jgi:hypothetical protein